MRDSSTPDDPASNAAQRAAFSHVVMARIGRHRRRRRAILLLCVVAAMLAAGIAMRFLPASTAGMVTPSVGDMLAAMVLIAACGIGWLLADARRV